MPNEYLSSEWPRNIYFFISKDPGLNLLRQLFARSRCFVPSSRLSFLNWKHKPQKTTEKPQLCATQLNIVYCFFSLIICLSLWLFCNAVSFVCCHVTLMEQRSKESNLLPYLYCDHTHVMFSLSHLAVTPL